MPPRLLAVGAAIVVAGSVFSSVTYVAPWHDDDKMPQRTFVDEARESLAARKGRTTIADTTVPDDVLWSAAFPANLVSHVLAPVKDRFRVVRAGNDLQIIGPTGRLSAASVPGEPRSRRGPDKGCGYAVSGKPRTIRIVPVVDFSFWASINYLGGSDGTVTISAGDTEAEVPVQQGLHTLLVQTSGAFDRVTITPNDGVSLCVDNVNVGPLAAVDAG